MKIAAVILFLVVVLVVAYAQSPPKNDAGVGRFQLVIAHGSSSDNPQVFKLDTVTGRTWIQGLKMEGENKILVFGEIPDVPPKVR